MIIMATALVLAPLGLSYSGGKVEVGQQVALAASSFLPQPGCVKIAVPLTGTSGNCVDNTASSGGAIVAYLREWLLLLSGLVGMVVMVMIVVAGVQYITSTGDPGLVKSAKQRIFNAILALVLYLMMFAILQFLVPGGIL